LQTLVSPAANATEEAILPDAALCTKVRSGSERNQSLDLNTVQKSLIMTDNDNCAVMLRVSLNPGQVFH
jgi:hypothetical protein